ncbi:MAG: alpha-galactosidase, partial [Bacilli bacterium]|nr:alpha-galactosidase [Bacilli bacterium]
MIKNIVINDKNYFLLTNKLLGLVLKIEYGKVEVIHFGADVSELDIPALDNPLYIEYGNSILYDQNDKNSCLNCLPLAFSERGIGDYRETGISLSLDNSNLTGDFVFDSFNIFNGTKSFDTPMPDARSDDKVETLELILKSKFDNDILVKLYFSLFETCLTRRSVIVNNSDKNITLNKLVSSLFDLKGDFDMITLDGGWIAEGSLNRTQVLRSNVVNKSTVGFSSNFHNPGFLLVRKDISEDYGFGYGFNIIYSGNHYSQAQKSLQNLTRVIQSMYFEDFKLKLNKGSEFVTPVAVCTYSRRGLNGISRNMHKFINNHIIPPQFKDADRPIVYNSWEGCGFDFNEGRLVRLAKESKEIGCELFVLDDGWFGERNNDEAGLGDYNVNKKKLPNGLKGLADKINKIGMKFGLWFEPESVNPNS